MNPDELEEGEFYWIRDLETKEVEVGTYYISGSGFPCFDLCGWEIGESVTKFEVLKKIERDYES